MSPEEVAERFAFARPGFTLIDYGLVGLPFWRTRIRGSIQARKPISPLREFILRAADAGNVAAPEIESLLGLDEQVVVVTSADLVREGMLRLSEGGRLEITPDGEAMLATLAEVVIEEREVSVFFDGLLRVPVDYIGDWAEPRDLKEEAIHEIPPSPARGPDIDDIREHLPRIQALMAKGYPRHEQLEDLLAIKAVDRRERVFKRAVALAFRAQRGGDVQVGFVIDGELSSVHEHAFAEAGLLKKVGIGKAGVLSARGLAEEVLGKELVERLEEDTAQALRADLSLAKQEALGGGELQRVERAKEALEALPVRPVATYDHPALLREAMEEAEERLLVISPWIKPAVVDHEFAKRLEALLARGVEVHIGWGIAKDERDEPDAHPRAMERLNRLAESYPNLVLRRLGDTHAKVLICDRRYVVVGSFNWLSFRGDPKRTFRDEQGTLVSVPEYVEREYAKFRARFDETTGAERDV
ncbi:MAG: phospholipase D-like domain-containing protein [Solirubrobacterales bacterium]